MDDVLKNFGLAPEREIYEILKHSTVEERLLLCENNKFKAMCKLIEFDTYSKKEGTSLLGLQQYGRGMFKVILDSFPNFSSGLEFIEGVKPGFIYTNEFKEYVRGYLQIRNQGNYTSYSLGDEEYRVFVQNGVTRREEWYKKGVLHRKYGPSIIEYYANGQKSDETWYYRGDIHRKGDAAVIKYLQNGEIFSEEWYESGKPHRSGNPARIIYQDGRPHTQEFYSYGKRIKF